jgi:hypothetical protein
LVAGYVIHEQLNGYYCTIAYNEWSDKHVFKIPLDNFSDEMDAIIQMPSIYELNLTGKGVVSEIG